MAQLTRSTPAEGARQPVAIVVTFDRSFVRIAQLFLQSLRLTGHSVEVIICHADLTSEDVSALRRQYPHIRLLDIRDISYPVGPPPLLDQQLNTPVLYARLLLWEPIFDRFERLLYLDVDLIVTDSLSSLFTGRSFTIFRDATAASNAILTDLAGLDESPPSWTAKIAAAEMANAGVFCVDREWRTPEQARRLRDLCHQFQDRLQWGDQSLINLWMIQNNLRPEADLRFNCQALTSKNDASFMTASIYHFCGMSGQRKRLAYVMKLSLVLLGSGRNGRTMLRWLVYLLPPYRRFGIGNAPLNHVVDGALNVLATFSYAWFDYRASKTVR